MDISKKKERLGNKNLNNQGYCMKVIEYNNARDVVVEFQDQYKAQVHTDYRMFETGMVRNPYHPHIYDVGITGNKFYIFKNNKILKEYNTWRKVLERSFDQKTKEKHPTYKDVTCCDEWLLYENFYEWLHEQPNFERWLNGDRWAIDKDILVKGNKVYSPNTCCLVPQRINSLFTKHDKNRNNLPIGVDKISKDKYRAQCGDFLSKNKKNINLGYYSTPDEAFQAYKQYKENYIKQVAQEEYEKGNITKRCYEAMMNYEVEVTD